MCVQVGCLWFYSNPKSGFNLYVVPVFAHHLMKIENWDLRGDTVSRVIMPMHCQVMLTRVERRGESHGISKQIEGGESHGDLRDVIFAVLRIGLQHRFKRHVAQRWMVSASLPISLAQICEQKHPACM